MPAIVMIHGLPRISSDWYLRRKRDPVKVNCEAGGENRQVKIDPGERGKTESDRKKIKSFHGKNIGRNKSMSRASLSSEQMTKSQ